MLLAQQAAWTNGLMSNTCVNREEPVPAGLDVLAMRWRGAPAGTMTSRQYR